jgi:hypothetical protein
MSDQSTHQLYISPTNKPYAICAAPKKGSTLRKIQRKSTCFLHYYRIIEGNGKPTIYKHLIDDFSFKAQFVWDFHGFPIAMFDYQMVMEITTWHWNSHLELAIKTAMWSGRQFARSHLVSGCVGSVFLSNSI